MARISLGTVIVNKENSNRGVHGHHIVKSLHVSFFNEAEAV
jgi:hypothetical protein